MNILWVLIGLCGLLSILLTIVLYSIVAVGSGADAHIEYKAEILAALEEKEGES